MSLTGFGKKKKTRQKNLLRKWQGEKNAAFRCQSLNGVWRAWCLRLCRSIPSLFLYILKYQHNNKKQQITKITLTSTPLRFDKLLFSSFFLSFLFSFLNSGEKVRFILPPSLKSAGKRKISFFPRQFSIHFVVSEAQNCPFSFGIEFAAYFWELVLRCSWCKSPFCGGIIVICWAHYVEAFYFTTSFK